jgi:CheY-like chemotaxis protein/HPt (histidine-containing phosphotransfer) domain-containing protein
MRVLVVDDNAAGREVVCEQLSSWGIGSEMAADGREALDVLRRRTAEGKPFGIVILDAQVLDMSGPALSQAIRDDPHIRKNVRIITVPIDDPLDPEAMAAAGITACLLKPVRQSRLFDAIVEAVALDAGGPHAAPRAAAAAPTLAEIAQSRGALILLAEDNEINQILAAEILKVAGYRCEVVGNGQEAIAALIRKPFDLVLMDCQMPEVDGLEATRRIRLKEGEGAVLSRRGGRLPVIALTANAISGERERCLAAGMDDYLTKPIIPEEMIRTLSSALSARGAPRPSPASPVRAEETPPFDLDELLTRCTGSRDFMAKMLDKFTASVGPEMERLEQSLSEGDLEKAARGAHLLKGMGANLSAHGVRQAALELEHACQAGRPDEASSALARLQAAVRRCQDSMPEALAGPTAR